MKKPDKCAIEDILIAHADALSHGQPARSSWPDDTGNMELRSLLAIAELVQKTLVPVQPNPNFMRSLGQRLLDSTRQGRQALTARARRAALIGAAALGSLVSVASVVGVIVYVMRHRVHRTYLT